MANKTALLSLSQTTDFGSNPVIMAKKKSHFHNTAQNTGRSEPSNVLLAEIVAFQLCFLLALSSSQEMLAGINMLSFNYRTALLL